MAPGLLAGQPAHTATESPRRQGPCESRYRLAWRDAARPKAAPHEQRRRAGADGHGGSHPTDAFGSPTLGKADDEEPSVACAFEDSLLTGADENGLGDDADDLLHQQ
jgi:hypothetical protein